MSDAKESVLDRIERRANDAGFVKDSTVPKAAVVPATTPTPAPSGTPTAKVPDVPTPDPDDFELDGKKVTMPQDISSEKTKSDWRTWKGMAKTKITALEKDIATLKEAPKLETKKWEDRIAAVESEKAQLRELLGQATIERTPEFQAHYVDRLNSEYKNARDIVGEAMADKVESILRLPESKAKREMLNAVFEELDTTQTTDIGVIRGRIRDILQERDEQIKNWKVGLEAKAKVEEQRSQANRASFVKAFEDRLAAARADKEEMVALQPRDGDAEWNKEIDDSLVRARGMFESSDPTVRANAAILAASHNSLLKMFKASQAEITALKQHIEGMKAKSPTIAPRGGDVPSSTVPSDKRESLAERIARRAAEAGFAK